MNTTTKKRAIIRDVAMLSCEEPTEVCNLVMSGRHEEAVKKFHVVMRKIRSLRRVIEHEPVRLSGSDMRFLIELEDSFRCLGAALVDECLAKARAL